MVVGLCRFELILDENRSLKGKRSIILPVIARVRRKFNVAIAEVDAHDHWDLAVLGFAVVANDAAHTSRLVEAVITWIETEAEAQLGRYEVEHLHAF